MAEGYFGLGVDIDVISARIGTDTRATSGISGGFFLGPFQVELGVQNENRGRGWTGWDGVAEFGFAWDAQMNQYTLVKSGDFAIGGGALMGAEAKFNAFKWLGCMLE